MQVGKETGQNLLVSAGLTERWRFKEQLSQTDGGEPVDILIERSFLQPGGNFGGWEPLGSPCSWLQEEFKAYAPVS